MAKIALWLIVKLSEALASRWMTYEQGVGQRTQLVDYLITRAANAKASKTTIDDSILSYWAGLLKSERLEAVLEK